MKWKKYFSGHRLMGISWQHDALCIADRAGQPSITWLRGALLHDPALGLKHLRLNRQRKSVLALPASLWHCETLSLPSSATEPRESRLLKQLRQRFSDNLNDLIIDNIWLPSINSNDETLIFSIERDKLNALLSAIEGVNINVMSAEPGLLCASRLLSSTEHKSELLVHFDTDAASFALLRNKQLDFTRRCALSVEAEDQRIKKEMKIGLEDLSTLYQHHSENGKKACQYNLQQFSELFISELEKVLIASASRNRGIAVEKIWLSGEIARIPWIFEFLQQQKLPVSWLGGTLDTALCAAAQGAALWRSAA